MQLGPLPDQTWAVDSETLLDTAYQQDALGRLCSSSLPQAAESAHPSSSMPQTADSKALPTSDTDNTGSADLPGTPLTLTDSTFVASSMPQAEGFKPLPGDAHTTGPTALPTSLPQTAEASALQDAQRGMTVHSAQWAQADGAAAQVR